MTALDRKSVCELAIILNHLRNGGKFTKILFHHSNKVLFAFRIEVLGIRWSLCNTVLYAFGDLVYFSFVCCLCIVPFACSVAHDTRLMKHSQWATRSDRYREADLARASGVRLGSG